MLESNTCGARPKATSEVLGHFWHPVARSEEVTDKPIKVKLLDQPLVLWRSDGRADRCVLRLVHSSRNSAFARLARQW